MRSGRTNHLAPSSRRAGVRAALACAIALAGASCERTAPSAPVKEPASAPAVQGGDPLARDDRLGHLVGGCVRSEPFLADTSDLVPVLVQKLSSGQLDPLRQAKEELVAAGPAILPELRRAFDAVFAQPMAAGRLQNMLVVAGLMESDEGRDLLLRGLEHPEESVRAAAVRQLARHARPEDYARLVPLLQYARAGTVEDLIQTLVVADRAQFARDAIPWIQEPLAQPLLEKVIGHLDSVVDPQWEAAARAHWKGAAGEVRLHLAAVAARAGDEEARAELMQALVDPANEVRSLVGRAVDAAGIGEEALEILRLDPDPGVRAWAIGRIAASPPTARTHDQLRAALDDASLLVYEAAFATLIARGDLLARDRALEFLGGPKESVEVAMRSMRPRLAFDEALARTVYERLRELLEGTGGPRMTDERALERAMGIVPLREAAQFLVERGRLATEPISGLAPHRFYAQIAGNAGPAGREWLRSQWDVESDPARRMDLTMAGVFEATPAARDFLLRVLDAERSTPAEKLQAADLLAKMGPASVVAGPIKRAALRISDPVVRPAFNCLLWTWYGPER